MEDFHQQVQNAGNKLVVVDFFATWYQPCRYMTSYLEKDIRPFAGKIVLLQVDLDTFGDFARKEYGVTWPTFVFVKNGKMAEKSKVVDNPATIERIILGLIRS